MTEDKAASTPAPEGASPPEKALNLTQTELNELLGKVRTETRTQSDREIAKIKADYDERSKLAAMEKDERIKAERDLELKKLTDELAASKHELRIRAAESELAKLELDTGLAGVVLGKDDDETKANIAALKKQVDAMVKKQLDDRLKTGAPGKGGAPAAGAKLSLDYGTLRGMGYTDAQAREYVERNKK